MKKLVLALSLISSPLFGAYSRYDFYDNVELFLDSCRIEDEDQYQRLDKVIRSIESLSDREKDMVYCYVQMVVENAKLLEADSCCTDEVLDDMIQEEWSSCEMPNL